MVADRPTTKPNSGATFYRALAGGEVRMVGMKGAFVMPETAVEPPTQPSTRIAAQFKAYQDLLGRPGIAGADYSSKDYVDQNNPFIVGTLAFTRAAIAAMRARRRQS